MSNVASILARKGNTIISISPTATVMDALQLMADKNIGSVAVIENENYLGIMTERDYSRKVILKGKNSTNTKVSEIMTADLPPVSADKSIEHCMELMTKNNIRYIPVMENGKLAGIISMSDIVKATILAQKETITHLQSYIQQ
ncbi:histidine kinase [Chitinophagaceae bacterium IBVUCB2]|nr:histidine kinase [Chitinophagaceae bacterium IBVUCB2]